MIGRETLEHYEAALQRLRPEEREAIVARVEMGYSYEELAQVLGKANGRCRSQGRAAGARPPGGSDGRPCVSDRATEDLAGAILDGRAVNWTAAESNAVADRSLVPYLRTVARIAELYRKEIRRIRRCRDDPLGPELEAGPD